MPIYEYECRSCAERFELLVLRSESPACPACGGTGLERLLSLPTVSSDGTRQRSRADAKERRGNRLRETAVPDHHHDDH
jgi:putative FmdB family regulatory protein